ncbi:hypothetical protein BVE84_03020 [Streptococcus azizii]|uniref:Uncharacterized protein n=1 Tax=Streptococcus azizii TaxID=1579424 RepID=A0AB36JTT1_9STRE|nr:MULTISPECIES: hypothetical protein [Streptococcus]MBF0775827.1 hypothetical protein [Streptococcus sp. 19428wD3_AN2]ONK29232.1 hypothetical protein BVE86_01710 [Streptococcus azizii]ONK29778.1 hypothetical protein BVE85_03025 [Streptococcus azizii]ONK30716.1 hypothetical protein BVE84_03020 [Streptococcus azizii]TFU84112.1 hypothetical protein E4T83_03435 [Streptococcus sp. AN2]
MFHYLVSLRLISVVILVIYLLLGISFIQSFHRIDLSKIIKTIFLLGYLLLLAPLLYLTFFILLLGFNS